MLKLFNIFKKKKYGKVEIKPHSIVKCKLTGKNCTELGVENCRYCRTYIRISNLNFYNNTEKELYKKYLSEEHNTESR